MNRRPIRLGPDILVVGALVTIVWSAALGVTIVGFLLALVTGNGIRLHLDGIIRTVRDGAHETYGAPGIVLAAGAAIVAVALMVAAFLLVRRLTKASDDWRHVDREKRIAASPVWAQPKDIPTLIDPEPVSRVVLGELAGQTVAARREHSVIVIAPPRSGKTVSVVVPAVLRWEGPAIITSTKRDVFDITVGHRSTIGPVWVFDPTRVSGRPSAKWSPIPGCDDWIKAEDRARELVSAARVQNAAEHAAFWEKQATMFIAPLLQAAALSDRHPSDVYAWVQLGMEGTDEIHRILVANGAQHAINAFDAALRLPPDTFGSVVATALTLFECYGSARMEPFTTVAEGDIDVIDWDALLDGRGTLYMLASDVDQEALRPVFEAMLASLVRRVADRHMESGQMLDPRLLLMLDEAAHVASPIRLPEWLNSYSGQGVNIVSVWQDLGQIEEIYGQARARAVLSGHPAKVWLGGISDTATLVTVRDLIGDQAVTTTSESFGRNGDTSATEATGDLDVASVSWLRRRPSGTAIGIVGELKPMQLVARPWFVDETLVALVPSDVRDAQARQSR